MESPPSEDLLPGVVAAQLGLIDQASLAESWRAWRETLEQGREGLETVVPGRGWIEFAIEQGRLPAEAKPLIESIAAQFVAFHGGDAERGLANLRSLRTDIDWIEQTAASGADEAYATQAPQPTAAAGAAAQAEQDWGTIAPASTAAGGDQSDPFVTGVSPPPHTPSHEPPPPDDGTQLAGALPAGPASGDAATVDFVSQATGEDTVQLPGKGATPFAPAPAPSVPGRRYQILRPHAAGGLGQVSVAFDTELSREVALKEIKPKYADDPDSRARFLLEGEVTGRLEHPGVVPVYGMGRSHDGRPYYAMRFIRGASLSDEIDAYHADEADDSGERAVRFRKLLGRFIDVCNTLGYAHSRGVLHRDIKPDNIMLGAYGETLVVDWGLAKLETRSGAVEPAPDRDSDEAPLTVHSVDEATATQAGLVVGTPAYMSPEQAAGEIDNLSPASDIYALGATLYHLLTGRRPFADRSVRKILAKVRTGDFDPPRKALPSIAPSIEAVCLKAMALRPEDRYATSPLLAEDLESWLADEPVTAWREPWSVRARRWMRKNRTWVSGGAAATLVALVGLSIGVVLLSAANERERLARVEAEDAFRTARSAVDKYFVTVSEDTLLKQPGMQKLRQNLLGESLSYFQGFLDQRSDDPSVRSELALTNFYVAKITEEVSSPDESLPFYEVARTQQDALVEADPADADLLFDLGDILNGHGRALTKANRLDEAIQAYGRAAEVREKLVRVAPENSEYRRRLANTYMNRGVVEQRRLAYAEARGNYQKAQEIRREALGADPSDLNLRRDLGQGFFNLAVLDELTLANGDRQQNLLTFQTHLQGAVAALEEVVADDLRDLRNRHNLAVCYRKLGTLEGTRNDAAAALGHYQQALDRIKTLALQSPDVAEFQATHAGVLMNMVFPLAATQQIDEASRSARRAAAIQRRLVEIHPGTVTYRRDLGVTLRALGVLQRLQAELPAAAASLRESQRQLAIVAQRQPDRIEHQQDLVATKQVLQQVEAQLAAEASDQAADEPTANEPPADEPTTDEPTTDEPTTDEPTTDEPTTDEPTADEPTADEPTADEPTANEPTGEGSDGEDSTGEIGRTPTATDSSAAAPTVDKAGDSPPAASDGAGVRPGGA